MNHAGAQKIFAHRARSPARDLCLLIAGSLAASCATALLAADFYYGGGYLARPVTALVAALLAASALWWLGAERLGGTTARRRPGPAVVVAVTVALALPHLWARPILENDFYRYLLDGGTIACRANPYLYTPAQQWLHVDSDCFAGDPRWPTVLERVSYAKLRTIYPPLAQLWFGAVVGIAGPSLVALRISFLLAVLAATLALARLLQALGKPPALAAVFAWSPLVWKELINSAHYDALPALALTCAALALARGHRQRAFALLGACAGLKLFAWLLLPLWLQAVPRKQRATALLAFAAVTLAAYLPFAGAGRGLFESTLVFAGSWQANAPLFTPAVLALQSMGVAAAHASTVVGILATAAVATVALWPLHASKQAAPAGTQTSEVLHRSLLVLVVLLVCGPVANPWYFCWILPLVALEPGRHWKVLLVTLPIYYFEFSFNYRGLQDWIPVATSLEFTPFFVVAALAAARRYRNRSSSAGRTIAPAPTPPSSLAE